MKFRSLFFSALCTMALSAGLTACSDDDDDSPVTPPETPAERVGYILNEGSWGGNNANLGRLSLSDYTYQGDWYQTVNETQLGDLAQDLKAYDGSLYVLVSGSQYVAKLDTAGLLQKSYSFTAEQGEPRSMAFAGGKLFVTSYSGQLHQLDAATLEYEKSVQVAESGVRLEGMAERDGKLYVAVGYKVIPATEPGAWDTYVYQREVAVVDAATLTKQATIPVVSNPSVLAACGEDIFLYSIGDYYMETAAIQRIAPDNSVDTLAVTANKMAVVGDRLFLVNAVTEYTPDYSSSTTVNHFMTYDVATSTVGGSFMTDAPAELSSATIYMIAADPVTGEFYVGTTDYVSTGTIYHFDATGKYLDKFDSQGVNPSKMVFM